MDDFLFYVISGRVTDSSANPLDSLAVILKKADCQHETEILASCRTNGRGEYYFEESLKQGTRLRIEVENPKNPDRPDYKEVTIGLKDEYSVNFVF